MKFGVMSFAVLALLADWSVSGSNARSMSRSRPPDTNRKYIVLPRTSAWQGLPFSDGVLVGDTLYIGGHVGIDPKTGKAGITAEEDAKFAMDAVKQTVEAAGMTMDDIVSAQVLCSSASDYAVFNGVYKKYFHDEYPARVFTQAGKILGESRFEVSGVAVRSGGRLLTMGRDEQVARRWHFD